MYSILVGLLSLVLVTPSWAGSRVYGGVSTDELSYGSYAAIDNLTTLTISAWFYRTGAGGGSLGRIADKSGADGLLSIYTGGGGTDAFQANRWDTTNGIWTWTTPSNSTWHHLCITYDYGSTLNDPVVYLNGSTPPTGFTENTAPAGALGTDSGELVLGNAASGIRNWAGNLGQIAIWNVVLTAAECSLLNSGVSPLRIRTTGLVLYAPQNGETSPEVNYAPTLGAQTGTLTGTVSSISGPPARSR